MIVSGSISPSGTAKDAIPPIDERHMDQEILGTTTTHSVREVTNSDQTPRSWGGGPAGWIPGVGYSSRPWGGIPTTVLTLTATVSYTQSSQSLSPTPMATEARKGGVNISGPAAAGIGAGAGAGLLIIGIVVYLCTNHSHRRSRQSAKELGSVHVKTSSDNLWPPYPFPASNESPVELAAVRLPQEMCAETRPQEKDSSSFSESVGLDRESPVVREERVLNM
ncbi:hypothetical protein F4859DRAFT_523190 [Xylaria cf. heliscus]|nr:hypothetical protein F4859DRAFT_523190 [Xylaria cf. heliscus]